MFLRRPAVTTACCGLVLASFSSAFQSFCSVPAILSDAKYEIASNGALIELQSSNTKPAFAADGRVQPRDPAEKPRLGEMTKIPLTIRVRGIQKLWTSQYYFDHETPSPASPVVPMQIPESVAELPIEFDSDGAAHITVRLLRVGQVKVAMLGRYPDGGVVNFSKILDVALPESLPKGIVVGQLGLIGKNMPFVSIPLGRSGNEPLRKWPLGATYESVKGVVPIDPTLATYKFRILNHRPVIAFNRKTGYYKPLEPGEEIVETTFGGLTNLTCIEVIESGQERGVADWCRPLLSPGERLAEPKRSGLQR